MLQEDRVVHHVHVHHAHVSRMAHASACHLCCARLNLQPALWLMVWLQALPAVAWTSPSASISPTLIQKVCAGPGALTCMQAKQPAARLGSHGTGMQLSPALPARQIMPAHTQLHTKHKHPHRSPAPPMYRTYCCMHAAQAVAMQNGAAHAVANGHAAPPPPTSPLIMIANRGEIARCAPFHLLLRSILLQLCCITLAAPMRYHVYSSGHLHLPKLGGLTLIG